MGFGPECRAWVVLVQQVFCLELLETDQVRRLVALFGLITVIADQDLEAAIGLLKARRKSSRVDSIPL